MKDEGWRCSPPQRLSPRLQICGVSQLKKPQDTVLRPVNGSPQDPWLREAGASGEVDDGLDM